MDILISSGAFGERQSDSVFSLGRNETISLIDATAAFETGWAQALNEEIRQ